MFLDEILNLKLLWSFEISFFFFVVKFSEIDWLLVWIMCCLDRCGVNCVMYNVLGKKCLEFINFLYYL